MPLDAHTGAPRPFARAQFPNASYLAAPHTATDLAILAQTCWAEPIGGSLRGMEIVAATALNFWRAYSKHTPTLTVAQACRNFGRFACWSWTPPLSAPAADDPRFAMARRAARRALNYGPFCDQAIDPTNGAVGYASRGEATPDWATACAPISELRGLLLYGPETALPAPAAPSHMPIQG